MNNLITEFDKLWNFSDPKATRNKFEEHFSNMKHLDSNDSRIYRNSSIDLGKII